MRARRPRLVLLVALTLAPAVPSRLAGRTADSPAIAGFFDLAVPGGSDTLDALRIPEEDRALTLTFLARSLHGQGNSATSANNTRATLAAARQLATASQSSSSGDATIVVPAPMSEAFWRDVLRLPRTADLFGAISDNRAALLVASGATAADGSIRALLDDDRDFGRWILERAPGAFVVVARSLRIEGGRLAVPGGAAAETFWEGLIGAPAARPAAFLRNLLTRDEGRLAWLYDTLASLEPPRLAWVLGDSAAPDRAERLRELVVTFTVTDPSWNLETHPFQRNAADAASLIRTLDLTDGRVTGPPWQSFWTELFARDTIRPNEARAIALSDPAAPPPWWLARRLSGSSPRERRARFDAVRLAQRVFPDPSPESAADLLVAMNAYRRYPALFLTLERIGVSTPATWATMAEGARRADRGAGRERRTALAAFQGAIAIVERARLMRAIDSAQAGTLLEQLAAGVADARPVTVSVASWIVDTLVPALPPLEVPDAWTERTAYESTILQAMAGLPGRDTRTVTWEGLTHTVDLAATERDRIHRLRALVPSPGLDAALASRRPDDLAAALVALVYAPALGDPDGDVALSPDLATRHDFGDWSSANDRRELGPWLPPRDMLGIDGPWRVEGSLLGLDLALARLMLHRVADQDMPRAPTINLNDWQTLVRGVAALDPAQLTDDDRDALAAAIARGRERVRGAAHDLAAFTVLAREARLSSSARELLPWMAARQPGELGQLFSLRDLLWLGQPNLSQARLDRWGVPFDALDGRRMPAMPRPAPWDDHAGHADDGRLATQVPDLTLRLAEETARLQLPARLIPALLAFAVQDFAHDVEARFADDWPAMVRAARELPAARIEDYVAALTGTGHLR